jgi:hypothetical protein
MNKCKVKKWDSVATDVNTLCKEIEDLCNSGEVLSVETFIFGRFFIMVAIFGKTE